MTEVVPARRRLDANLAGVGIFISSEAIFFVCLIVVYVYLHGRETSGPNAREVLDVGYAAVLTVLLLASSVTLHWASGRLEAGDRRGCTLGLAATLLLGAAFLAGQTYEYTRLLAENVTPARNLFGSAFYTLTGFHGLHVLVGLIALVVAFGVALAGALPPRRRPGLEAVALYWHFVDGVWLAVFSVVYLWTLL